MGGVRRANPGSPASLTWGVRARKPPLESFARIDSWKSFGQSARSRVAKAPRRSARDGIRAGWAMTTFYRGTFQELWLTLSSDEPLGILDTDFLEDWSGKDGSVSLLHVSSGLRVSVPMAPVPMDSRVNFKGWLALAGLPDGRYSIQGRMRDLQGNITILGDYCAPKGNERILHLDFEIAKIAVVSPAVRLGPLLLQGGMRIPAPLHFHVNPQGERICGKALTVSGFPSRLGVTLPAQML